MATVTPRYRTTEDREAGRVSGYAAVFYNPDRRPAQKYVTLRTRDQRIARRRTNELEKRESLGLWDPWRDAAPEYGLTLDETIERFTKARMDKRERTRKEEEATLRRFQRTLPTAMRLDQVEARHVERYVDAPKPDGSVRAPATRRRYHAVLSYFFGWCVREGLIEQDPTERLAPPKVYRKEARYLTEDEVGALLRTIEADAVVRSSTLKDGEIVWLADLVRLQVGTGMRIGEVAALRWSAVHLDGRPKIIVGKHELTKSGHQRAVPVAGEALAVLKRLRDERTSEADDFVLTGATGSRLNEAYASKRIKRYAQRAGLGDDVTSHTLRHTYGAILASNGVSLYKIKELMGHESIDTTTRFYGHLNPEHLHAAVEGVFGTKQRQAL